MARITRDDVRRRQSKRRAVKAIELEGSDAFDGLYARELYCGELNRMYEQLEKNKSPLYQAVVVASYVLADEDGRLIFDEGDTTSFENYTAAEIAAINKASDDASGFSKTAEDTIEKN